MRIVIGLVAFGLFDSAEVSARTLHVFLLGGQSNAGGHGRASRLPANVRRQADVPYFYRASFGGQATVYSGLGPGAYAPGRYGPEIPFAYYLTRFFRDFAPGDRVAIVKYAAAGTSLYRDWRANGTASSAGDGESYQIFQSTVAAALAAFRNDSSLAGYELRFRAMLWVQGEGDIELQGNDPAVPAATEYAGNLADFIADVRATLGTPLPFYLARFSLNQTYYVRSPLHATLRAAQEDVAATVPGTRIVDTDASRFRVGDTVHYDDTGLRALGLAFARLAALEINPRADLTRLTARPRVTVDGGKKRLVSTARCTLRGRVSGDPDTLRYRLRGIERPVKILAESRGGRRWQCVVRLRPGRNRITMTASSYDGKSAPAILVVTRR